MGEKIRKLFDKVCDVIELLLAAIVVLWMLYRLGFYVVNLINPATPVPNTEAFMAFLHNIFNFVVGIEFTKVLLKPSVDNVIEVLVFLVTRHLILDPAGPASLIVSVLCILLLYSFHFFVHYLRKKSGAFSEAVVDDASYIGGVEEKDDVKHEQSAECAAE